MCSNILLSFCFRQPLFLSCLFVCIFVSCFIFNIQRWQYFAHSYYRNAQGLLQIYLVFGYPYHAICITQIVDTLTFSCILLYLSPLSLLSHCKSAQWGRYIVIITDNTLIVKTKMVKEGFKKYIEKNS